MIDKVYFAGLASAKIFVILTEKGNNIGSEMIIYRTMREEGLPNHRGRVQQMRKKGEMPMLEARK